MKTSNVLLRPVVGASLAQAWGEHLDSAMLKFGISDTDNEAILKQRVCMFLANVCKETYKLTKLEEDLRYRAERIVVVDVYPFNDRIKTSVTSDISNNFQNVTDFGGTQNDEGSEVGIGIEFSKFMYNQSKHFQLANNIEIKLITDDNDLDLLDQESINNLARMLVSNPL